MSSSPSQDPHLFLFPSPHRPPPDTLNTCVWRLRTAFGLWILAVFRIKSIIIIISAEGDNNCVTQLYTYNFVCRQSRSNGHLQFCTTKYSPATNSRRMLCINSLDNFLRVTIQTIICMTRYASCVSWAYV